ncbi:hypothetical protein CPJ18_02390 [Agrobacterium rosae]|uniref:Uncharacterized protein n=1 Tax=Agrobacterium rosae TaxID=1972867 RepID=A0AAE5S1Y3_9HYPH|nr:hypothetical protein [Agrobacterium rosae]POO54366.1 hypothetical protein CPJ18_02390 [Agrobacterium rosae]
MKTIIFNSRPPIVTNLRFTPEIGDWPVDDWKYADVQHVYLRTTDLVRRIIDATPISGEFRRVLIDVKVQDLTPDVHSCIPGWHIDGAFPHPGIEPDRHHLFVMNGPLTEFINEPVECEVGDPVDMTEVVQQIPPDVRVSKCASNAITTFTSLDFHRGVVAEKKTRRLLVRLTETNTVLAHNRPKSPSVGARRP